MYLRFPIGVGTDHNINQHWLFGLPCFLKCTLKRCSQFVWCFSKVTLSSKSLYDFFVMSVWLKGRWWKPKDVRENSQVSVLIVV